MSDWIKTVTTDTVNTPPGVMTLPAEEMVMMLLFVNPGLPLRSHIQWIQYYINRAGKSLSQERRAEAEKAKIIIQQIKAGQLDIKDYLP